MMCQRTGRPPISTIGLGRNSVSSRRRVPRPPHRITTFTAVSLLMDSSDELVPETGFPTRLKAVHRDSSASLPDFKIDRYRDLVERRPAIRNKIINSEHG